MKIVETDNFGGDYPDEKFVNLPWMNEEQARKVANVLNEAFSSYIGSSRFWLVVPDDYKLQPGFEP